MSKLKIAVDFDGVIHSYTSKWVSPQHIPDPPVPGAIDWLNKIRYGGQIEVFIFTTRAQTWEGIKAVQRWMRENDVIDADRIVVTSQKLPAHMYIDDRGYRFVGNNFPTADEIRASGRWGALANVPA